MLTDPPAEERALVTALRPDQLRLITVNLIPNQPVGTPAGISEERKI